MHYAAAYGRLEVVQFLASLYVNPNPEADDGETPLSLAKARGNEEVEKYLESLVANYTKKSFVREVFSYMGTLILKLIF